MGGTVMANGASVQIPMGALMSPVTITIMNGDPAMNLPPGLRPVGPVIVFGPEGQSFGTPSAPVFVTLTLPTTETPTAVYTRPLGLPNWTLVGDEHYDPTTRAAIAHVNHFSAFVPVAPDPDAAVCNPPMAVCGGTCVDLRSDASNCGACGNACAMGAPCMAGQCGHACPTNQMWCTTSNSCADLTSDPNNCGACGRACSTGQICSLTMCRNPPMCSAPMTLCGGICTNLQTDVFNCGMCGHNCSMLNTTCMAGVCGGMGCPGGSTMCGVDCIYTDTNAMNCGACGNACAAGQTCMAGVCH
jgi:hypothetical protein